MISLLAKVLLFAGSLILAGALGPVRLLMAQLPQGSLRRRWRLLTALIGGFLLGYLSYAVVFWNGQARLLDLLVPGIFFFGACFVRLTATLALETAIDVRRTSLLELENVTDPLTGAFNRRYLDRRLCEEVTRARRYDVPLSIVFLDIDHFKRVNDQYGHLVGDQVLVVLGRILVEKLRTTDVLTRYGGEEFVIITPHTPLLGAAEIAGRLLKDIEAYRFTLPDQPVSFSVTCSAGVASLGEGIDGVERLLHVADQNLYCAKQEGRNRVIADRPVLEPGHPEIRCQ